jgi:hypothetical protein
VRQLIEDFARYIYLPRLSGPQVLLNAIADGLALLTWEQESFAYADSYDEAAGRYRGLRPGQPVMMLADPNSGVLVKPDVARRQLAADSALIGAGTPEDKASGQVGAAEETFKLHGAGNSTGTASRVTTPKRFHGTVNLDPTRLGRDAGRVGDEVVAHLAGLVNANVRVTLEIDAEVPAGVPEQTVRTVTENCRTLKFRDHGFEEA